MAHKDVGAALPGVAIAVALMPPLAVVDLGLSLGDAQVAGGAFLLFITNVGSTSLAGTIIFVVFAAVTLVGVVSRAERCKSLTRSCINSSYRSRTFSRRCASHSAWMR